MSRSQPNEMWTVESGEYSDHRVLCVCRTKKLAQELVDALNGDSSRWGNAFIGSLPVATGVNYVTTYTQACEVWDDGTTTQTTESIRTELDIDMLWPERAKPVGWRWVRAPIHNGKGGRLEVFGTDLEAVRRTFSDRRAQLIAEDAFRSRREAKS